VGGGSTVVPGGGSPRQARVQKTVRLRGRMGWCILRSGRCPADQAWRGLMREGRRRMGSVGSYTNPRTGKLLYAKPVVKSKK